MENLYHLVRHLTGNCLPVAVLNHSFFVNDVPVNLSIENNSQRIASVIGRILSIVTGHVKNTCIRLSAKKHEHVIVLEIQESGIVNSFALASDLQHVHLLAVQIGGSLSISIPRTEITTVSFSFPCLSSYSA